MLPIPAPTIVSGESINGLGDILDAHEAWEEGLVGEMLAVPT